jgi:hypothetical protein
VPVVIFVFGDGLTPEARKSELVDSEEALAEMTVLGRTQFQVLQSPLF